LVGFLHSKSIEIKVVSKMVHSRNMEGDIFDGNTEYDLSQSSGASLFIEKERKCLGDLFGFSFDPVSSTFLLQRNWWHCLVIFS
jgi:hypothetical protein